MDPLRDDIQTRYGGPQRMAPYGMVSPGNIDLANRPIVRNPDGSISTELSFSRGTDAGETVVPQVVSGRILEQNQAWNHYRQTGENMGTFATPEYADSYAIQTHGRPINMNQSHRPVYTNETVPVSPSPKRFAHAGRR